MSSSEEYSRQKHHRLTAALSNVQITASCDEVPEYLLVFFEDETKMHKVIKYIERTYNVKMPLAAAEKNLFAPAVWIPKVLKVQSATDDLQEQVLEVDVASYLSQQAKMCRIHHIDSTDVDDLNKKIE